VSHDTFQSWTPFDSSTAYPTNFDLNVFLTSISYTVAASNVWSGASYVFSKDAVKILSRKESEGKQGDSRRNIGP